MLRLLVAFALGVAVGATIMAWTIDGPAEQVDPRSDSPATVAPARASVSSSTRDRTEVPLRAAAPEEEEEEEEGTGAVEEETPVTAPLLAAPRARALVVADIEALVASGTGSRWEYRDLLRELVDIGSSVAIGAALDQMKNEELDFPHRASTFAELLADVDDPRVAEVANEVLQTNLADGFASWSHTRGYIDLVAAGAGPQATERLRALIAEGGPHVAHGAAAAVATLKDRSRPEGLFAALDDTKDTWAYEALAGSLASWEEPVVTEQLFRKLREDPLTSRQEDLAVALARHADVAQMERLLSVECHEDVRREMIYGLAHSDAVDTSTKVHRLLPYLRADMERGGAGLERAITEIRENPALRDVTVRGMVAELHARTVDRGERRRLKKLLSEL